MTGQEKRRRWMGLWILWLLGLSVAGYAGQDSIFYTVGMLACGAAIGLMWAEWRRG